MIRFGIDVYDFDISKCLRVMMANPDMVFAGNLNHDTFRIDSNEFSHRYRKIMNDSELFKVNPKRGGGFTLIPEVKAEAGKNDKNPFSRVVDASTERVKISGIETPIGE